MKVEATRCDVCGKEDKDPKGWAHVYQRCNGSHDRSQFSTPRSDAFISILPGGASTKSIESRNVDLCSRECAATWLFGAP